MLKQQLRRATDTKKKKEGKDQIFKAYLVLQKKEHFFCVMT
jgi:hypothetical protein